MKGISLNSQTAYAPRAKSWQAYNSDVTAKRAVVMVSI